MPNLIKKSWTVSIKDINDTDDHENPGVIVKTNESEISKQDFVFESIKEYMEEIGFEHVEFQKAVGDDLMEEVVKKADPKNDPQDLKDDPQSFMVDVQDLKNDPQDLKDDPKGTINNPQVNFENSDDFETMEENDNPGKIMFLHMCEICGKDFAGPVTLKIHERFHINDNIIPNDHLQIIPQDLQGDPKNFQDHPKDLQDDPQDLQDDPQKVHDDPIDLQDDPQESFEPDHAAEIDITETFEDSENVHKPIGTEKTGESLPILEELEITMLEAQESEIFKQDCIFESFKEFMEGIGCDNVELQKAIDNLKLMNKSFEPECADETDTFEQSESIDKLIENEKTDEPNTSKELESRMTDFETPKLQEKIENTDKTDVTHTFEESEKNDIPIETEKTNEHIEPDSQDLHADFQDLNGEHQDFKDDPQELKNDPRDLIDDPKDLHADSQDFQDNPYLIIDDPKYRVSHSKEGKVILLW